MNLIYCCFHDKTADIKQQWTFLWLTESQNPKVASNKGSNIYLESVCRPGVSVTWKHHTWVEGSWNWTGWWRKKLSGQNPVGSPAKKNNNKTKWFITTIKVLQGFNTMIKFRMNSKEVLLIHRKFYETSGFTLLTSTLSPSFSLIGSISHDLLDSQI